MRKPIRYACAVVTLVAATAVHGQTPAKLNPWASYVDVGARRSELKHSKDPRVRLALEQIKSCVALPVVAPPIGPMQIPQHYLSGGHGAINPAEAPVTAVYGRFETRVTAGMNQYLATGNHEEAACAQDQIDRWAVANTLLDYDPIADSQAWFQVEWTLSSVATSESVLLNDFKLDESVTSRDAAWINRVAHRMIGFPSESQHRNNHHDWRGLAAIAAGVVSNDPQLFNFGVAAYKNAVDQIDQRGAFPLEMARHERAVHYQAFALQPLIPLAAFAERQHVPLFNYKSPTGHTLADAIDFLGKAVADPSVIKAYTPDQQLIDSNSPDFFAAIEFYVHQFPHRKLPPAIQKGLSKPTYATRLGGSTTVLAGR